MPYYVIQTDSSVTEKDDVPDLIKDLLNVQCVRGVTVHIRDPKTLREFDKRYEYLPSSEERRAAKAEPEKTTLHIVTSGE